MYVVCQSTNSKEHKLKYMLQCVAACYSALQYVTLRCSVQRGIWGGYD